MIYYIGNIVKRLHLEFMPMHRSECVEAKHWHWYNVTLSAIEIHVISSSVGSGCECAVYYLCNMHNMEVTQNHTQRKIFTVSLVCY